MEDRPALYCKFFEGMFSNEPHLESDKGKMDELRLASVQVRIDRFDLFAIVKRIVYAGGQFRSLAEPWADTSTSKQPGA